ncbi:MAG: DUF4388 domain-containing protein [Thermoanaerobaculales bacterium]|nr:DUF4388 domain-containing protein [Thermoanaerobaculales bacterium]
MAVVGQLGDLDLTELFHVLSLFRKTGRLTLSADEKKGVFLFKGGKIIHAVNGTTKETLGGILVDRNYISAQTLRIALDLQASESTRRRLGAVLVKMGAISQNQIEKVVREQLQGITEEFLHLDKGFFSFKPMAGDDSEQDRSAGAEIHLPGGMNTDQFILDLLTRLDEVETCRVSAGTLAQELDDAENLSMENPRPENLGNVMDYMMDSALYGTMMDNKDAETGLDEGLAELRSLMVEIQLRTPSFTGEIALMILRYATRVVNRGILCHISEEGIIGIGQFGLAREGESTEAVDRRIRTMSIPVHEPSVFMEVLETMHSYQGLLKPSWWNDQLVRLLGGPPPHEVVVIPIIVDGMIAGMFYGDNAPQNKPIGPIHALEILMIEAGLAMEKRFLRSRLNQVEKQLEVLRVESGGRS